MPTTRGYDEKCFELAEHFLPDDADFTEKDSLAHAIQSTVEDWTEEWLEEQAPR